MHYFAFTPRPVCGPFAIGSGTRLCGFRALGAFVSIEAARAGVPLTVASPGEMIHGGQRFQRRARRGLLSAGKAAGILTGPFSVSLKPAPISPSKRSVDTPLRRTCVSSDAAKRRPRHQLRSEASAGRIERGVIALPCGRFSCRK